MIFFIVYDIRGSTNVARKVILVKSPIMTSWSHLGRSLHNVVKYAHPKSLKMSFKCEPRGPLIQNIMYKHGDISLSTCHQEISTFYTGFASILYYMIIANSLLFKFNGTLSVFIYY